MKAGHYNSKHTFLICVVIQMPFVPNPVVTVFPSYPVQPEAINRSQEDARHHFFRW